MWLRPLPDRSLTTQELGKTWCKYVTNSVVNCVLCIQDWQKKRVNTQVTEPAANDTKLLRTVKGHKIMEGSQSWLSINVAGSQGNRVSEEQNIRWNSIWVSRKKHRRRKINLSKYTISTTYCHPGRHWSCYRQILKNL